MDMVQAKVREEAKKLQIPLELFQAKRMNILLQWNILNQKHIEKRSNSLHRRMRKDIIDWYLQPLYMFLLLLDMMLQPIHIIPTPIM